MLNEYVQANKLGAKIGEGFYLCDEEKIKKATQKRLDVTSDLSKY